MEKQVIFRDRQEFQAADPNALQGYVRGSFDHLVADAVSDQKHYTGFDTVGSSATEVTTQPGRYYNGGVVYVAEQEQAFNLFQYVPLVTNKIVAIVAWGQEVDTDIEPRDFLVDLQTGATEPQAVAMERVRHCEVSPLPGAESPYPQPPVLQSGTLAVAYVYMTPSGIERVEMQTDALLPNGYDHEVRLDGIEDWKAWAEPRISSIGTDLAALSKRTDNKVDRAVFLEVAGDVALVKDKLQLPASYASYDADAFATDDKQNDAHAGYSARVDNGLLFPFASLANLNLALFNPIDASVKASGQGLVLPAYTHAPRIQTLGYSGDLSASQYQVQSHTLRAVKVASWRWHYGWHFNHYARWYGWNYLGLWYWRRPWWGYWYSVPTMVYEDELTTDSYSGAIIAQTFLVANAMWLTRIGLAFTQIGAAGDVQVVVCETEAGKPVLQKVVAQATVAVGDLQKYPLETTIDLPHALLEAGKRYAVALITTGDHRVATVSGNDYTQGTLFYGSDGDYFSGDLTKDLMFTVYGAQFNRARIEVQLQSIALANGMTDIGIEAPHVVPDGCTLQYEIQPQGSGAWYPLGDASMVLGNDATAPNLCNLRAVMLGTSDLQPAFLPSTGAIAVSRPNVSFESWSTTRTLAAATTSVTLKLMLAEWDAAYHTITPKIVTGGSTETAPSTTVTTLDADGITRKTYTFTIPSASSYEIKISGTRQTGSQPFSVINRVDIAL
jgi:hypothetical protein